MKLVQLAGSLTAEVEKILENIHYKDWTVETWVIDGNCLFRLITSVTDVETHKDVKLESKGFYLGLDWTETEVVDALHEAVMQAETHEVNETFIYEGRRPYYPHTTIRQRMRIAGKAIENARTA